MASININRQLDDPFNRYKMPKLIVQTQGGKSILVNLADIGQALYREPLCNLSKTIHVSINIQFLIRSCQVLQL